MDEKAKDMMTDLMNKGSILRLCFFGLISYIVLLIIIIINGTIGFPIGSLLFTILPLFILLFPLKIIGTVHLAAMISMFVWM